MASRLPSVSGGETFESRLNLNESFTQAQLLVLIAALADELREAHRNGRFHGAIIPADIGFDEAGEVSLGGWGRDTTPNAMQNSAYAPIERYAPVHPQGPWTDVYALAAILWRAMTGAPPAAVLNRRGDVTLERLAPSGYDQRFLRAVDAALAVAPQRRPPDVDSWLAALATPAPAAPIPERSDRAGADVAAASAPAAPPPTAARWPRMALAAAVIAAIGGGIYLAPTVEPRLAPPPVQRAAPTRPVPAPQPASVEPLPPTLAVA
ncbi:MAG: hypothetical protein Q7J32_17760, partial [Sphingomonadaceae bacterium]|nr:hypothetical protein [Sphingomonadaceae bacterium]